MVEPPGRDRKFNEEEVALIIKRAAELQQTEQAEHDPGNALTLPEVEQIAREAGIDPRLVRHAALGLDRPHGSNRPSPWVGAPTRIVFERVIDGEVPAEEFENLINEVRRSLGDNGVPSVLGKTLAWSSSTHDRRRASGRQVDVTIAPRSGSTTIRETSAPGPSTAAVADCTEASIVANKCCGLSSVDMRLRLTQFLRQVKINTRGSRRLI